MLTSTAYVGASTRVDIASSAAINMSTRTASFGSFIKSELFRRSSESESAVTRSLPMRKLSKSNRKSTSSPDVDLFSPRNCADQNEDPNRLRTEKPGRGEKGPKLMSKALGSVRSKSMHFLRPKPSKESLLRHVSLKNHQASIQVSPEIPSLNMSRFSFEPDSADTADPRCKFRISTGRSQAALSPSFVLYPEITIVPEVRSVDARGESSLWVAVIVTGTLREAGASVLNPGVLSRENGYTRVSKKPPGNQDKNQCCKS
jgi:hypothetical protein